MISKRETNELVEKSLEARRFAHAPYSGFKVGAAVKTSGGRGEIITGCNVENASYGATICAERVAICKAVSEGMKKFTAIAVATGGRKPAPACGVCLQFMTEFCEDLTIILVAAKTGEVEITSLKKLLPVQFKFEK